jgi:hypothetical protein
MCFLMNVKQRCSNVLVTHVFHGIIATFVVVPVSIVALEEAGLWELASTPDRVGLSRCSGNYLLPAFRWIARSSDGHPNYCVEINGFRGSLHYL